MALDREQAALLFKVRADSSEANAVLTRFREFVSKTVADLKAVGKAPGDFLRGFKEGVTSELKNLGGLDDAIKRTRESMDDLRGSSLQNLAFGISGIAGVTAAAAAGLGALALKTADYAGEISDLSAKTTLTTDTLQSLQLAATLSGQSFEAVAESTVIFQRRIEEAKAGNKDLKATFDALGVSLSGPVDQSFRQTLERLSTVEDGSQKTAAAIDLFGRSGANLLPIMQQVGGSFQSLENRARDLGLILDAEAIKKADEFGDQIDILKVQLGGLANQIGAVVIPAIGNYVTGLSNAIALTKQAADSTRSYSDRLLDAAKSASLLLSYLNPLPGGAASRLLLSPDRQFFQGPGINELTGLPEGGGVTLPTKTGGGGKGKEPKLPNLPIKDFSNLVDQYFAQLTKLEEEQFKRLEQARERSARVMEDILREQQDREIEAIRAQVDQRVITEEEGAARIAAVRVAAFARTEDQLVERIRDLDEQVTRAQTEAAARPFDNILQRRAQALQAERDLVRQQLTLIQEERTSIEELGNQAIAAARDRDLQDLLDYANEQKKIYQDLAEARKQAEQLDPLSARSIFGDAFADTLRRTGSELQAFRALFVDVAQSLKQESADLGSITDTALNSFTQGLSAMVEQLILTGSTGPAALRQLTAAVLLNVAKMAAVKAIFALAEGFIQLALFNFPAAAAAFKAAALYGAVAVAAGVAGGAIAPASSAGGNFVQQGRGQRGDRVIEQGDRQRPEPQIIIIRAETEPGVVVRKVVEDYRGNGATRQVLRRDMLGDGG